VTHTKEHSLGTVYLLKRAELAVRSCVEAALAPFRLTPTQFLLLLRLEDTGGMSSAELARAAGVRPQSIVDLIGPLEREGWIKRREAPEHRRILRVSLSPAGKQLLARARAVAMQLENELLGEVGDVELTQLREGLTKLLANAEAHDTHPVVRRSAAQAATHAETERTVRKSTREARPRRRAPST
jgi:DNA-binding MarR family transcriptional regulator